MCMYRCRKGSSTPAGSSTAAILLSGGAAGLDSDGSDPRAAEFAQPGRGDREDRIRAPRGGPDDLVAEQVLVHVDRDVASVPKWWHAADRITGRRAHGVGVGLHDRLAGKAGQPRRVKPVGAADQ